MAEPVVAVESPHGADALALIRSLSAELGARYGDDGAGAFKPGDVDVAGAAFVVARLDGRPVGCGALRPLEPGVGEVKRMFVESTMRGRGISRLILRKIEAVAAEFGYQALRLETGLRQPEAIGLYETSGYRRTPCYGIYVDNPLSVCFEKQLPLPQPPPLLGEGADATGHGSATTPLPF
jgi:putative acetyltransferase